MRNRAREALERAFKFAYKPKPSEQPKPLAHKPGDIITMRCGSQYRVEKDGSWTRIYP